MAAVTAADFHNSHRAIYGAGQLFYLPDQRFG
jgi:hypothetical protein